MMGVVREVAGPSLPEAFAGFRVCRVPAGSGRNSSLCVWINLSWFPPELSLELRPTDRSTALPVLGGLVRRVPSAMLVVCVAVTV